MTSPAAPTCQSCGAPDPGDVVICKFCKQSVSAEVQRTAIPCPNPSCRTPNRWGKQHCVQCRAWIVVACVFCGALSPHNVSNCLSCQEAFAGAPQRKAQREQQRAHHQNMQQMNAVGNIASGFLGGMAGGMIGSSIIGGIGSSDWSDNSSGSDWSGDSGSDNTDFTGDSGMSDGASFDWGGGGDDSGGSSDDF